MRLRHPTTNNISKTEEVSAPKRTIGRKLTQWVYIAILAYLAAYALFYIGYQMFYFNERGFVTVEHVVIASARGGRIRKEYAGIGDHVKKGALLLRISSPNECRRAVDRPAIRALMLKNDLDRQKLRMLIGQRNAKRKELGRMQYLRSLELFAVNPNRIRSLRDELVKLDDDINLLRLEIRLREGQIKALKALHLLDTGCEDELIRAPADGTVVAVERKAYEVVQRAVPIMDFVEDDAKVVVHSILKNKYYESLTLGKELRIRFPDGSDSKGRIIKIESTSVPFAMNRIRRNYIPERTRILTIIEPMDRKEAKRWRSFMEMEVEVMGWR